MMSQLFTLACLLVFGLLACAEDLARNFSGNWVLDEKQSDWRSLPAKPGPFLAISQQGPAIHCTEAGAAWSFRIDGMESRYRLNYSSMNSVTKWEGSALLINTLVSGPQNYVVMDRWKMSQDHAVLKITRTVQRGASETEAVLVYRNRDVAARVAAQPPTLSAPVAPSSAAEFAIKAGTRIPLALSNSLSTKHSAEGDRVYLETVFPITQQGRIVIPKGSYVSGTVTEVKRAGRVKGKAELFLRFDSLTLPNGVTRDFRARLDSADSGDVDRSEGKIHGEGNKAGDARTVGEATGVGAAVGGIAGRAAGHAGMGVGIGAATGAAAGLAGVLLSRGPDLVLPKGATFEMVLDRTLRFDARELDGR